MPAVIPIAAAVVGGAIASSGAKSAANTQAAAADRATSSQDAMFNKTVDLNAPFRQAGVDATSRLNTLLGIGNPAGAAAAPAESEAQIRARLAPQFTTTTTSPLEYGQGEEGGRVIGGGVSTPTTNQAQLDAAVQSEMQRQASAPAAGAAPADPSFGSLNKPFSMDDFQLDPGIKFQTEQGNLALTNSMAAKNGSLSGGALKALIGYNQGMAGTGYQSAFDRYMANKSFTLGSLMDMSKLGQGAAANTTSAAPSFSSGIAGTITGAGNAQAAGTVGSANALSGAATGAGNFYYLNSLIKNQNADLGGPITTSANPGGVYIAPNA